MIVETSGSQSFESKAGFNLIIFV